MMEDCVPRNMKILYSQIEVERIIKSLAAQIYVDQKGEFKNVVFLIVLKGGEWFGSRLIDALVRLGVYDFEYDFIGVSTYGNSTHACLAIQEGRVKINFYKHISINLEGKDIWIIDDILDTGQTLSIVSEYIKTQSKLKNMTIKSCTLVDKPRNRIVNFKNIEATLKGFNYIGDYFLLGCGMGLGERYRCIPHICEFTETEQGV